MTQQDKANSDINSENKSKTKAETDTITNAHDLFFRGFFQYGDAAVDFFLKNIPSEICDALDLSTLKHEKTSYIDDYLRETISDMVFSCHYLSDELAETPDDADNHGKKQSEDQSENRAKSVEVKFFLLVEHQSTPQHLLPFRVFNYLFDMLHAQLKNRPKNQFDHKLPAVYVLVFYNGKQTPYPYSLNLKDCFHDPLGIMDNVFSRPIPLIDVNQIDDNDLQWDRLADILTSVMKHIRDKDRDDYFLKLFHSQFFMDSRTPLRLHLSKMILSYLLNTGIVKIKRFTEGEQALPEPIRGEFMTTAEYLKAKGLEQGLAQGLVKGRQEGLQEVAINMIKTNMDPTLISQATGLELTAIATLKAKLDASH